MGEIWNGFRAGSRAPIYVPSAETTEGQRIILPRTNVECGRAGVCLPPPPRPSPPAYSIGRTGVEDRRERVPQDIMPMPRVS